MRHIGCVTDREAKELWRDYQGVTKNGNPLGVSFVEYVFHRVAARQPVTVTSDTTGVPWYIASCGHQHPWGESCATWTDI